MASLTGFGALAAEPIGVRGGVHADYARIVFDWPRSVGFEAEIRKRILHVRFDQPMTPVWGDLAERLAGHVTRISMKPDEKSLEFELSEDYELRSSTVNTYVVFDLYRAEDAPPNTDSTPPEVETPADDTVVEWTESEEPSPAPSAVADPSNEPVESTSLESNAEFTRVVFELKEPFTYALEERVGQAIISFAGPRTIDVSTLDKARDARVPAVEVIRSPNGSAVRMAIPPDAEIQHTRSGNKVTIDVISARLEPPEPAIAQQDVTDTLDNAPAQAPTAEKSELKDVLSEANREVIETTESVDQPMILQGAQTTAQAADASPASPINIGEENTPPSVAHGSDRVHVSLANSRIAFSVRGDGKESQLRFNTPGNIPAVIFGYGGSLWVVFDDRFDVDLTSVALNSRYAIVNAEQLPHPSSTILKFGLRAKYEINARRRGTLWLVTLSERRKPPAPIEVLIDESGPRGSRVILPVTDASQPVKFTDPLTGNALIVTPIGLSGVGVEIEQRFIEFTLLATAQGIAIAHAVEDLVVTQAGNGVSVSSPGGLDLDRIGDIEHGTDQPEGPRQLLFKLASWRRGGEGNFTRKRQELQNAAAVAPAILLTRSRLALARFLFAHGYNSDSDGVLEVIGKEDPTVVRELEYRALRAVNALLMDDRKISDNDLNSREYNVYDDIALWRGVLALRRGETRTAAEFFARAGDVWRELPSNHRGQIGLLIAEAAVEVGDSTAASTALNLVISGSPRPDILERATYVRGRIIAYEDSGEPAQRMLRNAMNGRDRLGRSRAALAYVNLLLRRDEMTREKAIETLEMQLATWRGDSYELAVLERLADLYTAEGRYKEALSTLKYAVTYFTDHIRTPILTKRMDRIFADLFLYGRADNLPPLAALALYEQFRELTPVGDAGNTMIQGLADRLAAVDLLNRASELLEHQVEHRLTGTEKARVATRLAVLHLMNKLPDNALSVLQSSATPGLPVGFINERRHLSVRALAELGRGMEALSLLAGDFSRDADLLRADIYWKENEWSATTDAIERLLKPESISAPLSPFVSAHILKLAVARSLAQDTAALHAVNVRYAGVMADDANGEAFALITSEVDRTAFSYRELPAAIAQIGGFEAFMENYRDRLRDPEVSEVN